MSSVFLPSMIEVEFGNFYKKCTETLFSRGFKSFHMDFGDKYLINRELECWDKVNFLKRISDEIKLTAHIMSISGNHELSVERITERCMDIGFEIIYIHSRSFKDFEHFYDFKEKYFKNAHNIFGVVSEVTSYKNNNLVNFVEKYSVQNILQMGVPIGKGGQKFCWDAEKRIEDFSSISSIKNIELDGGLTFEVVNSINKENIDRFAGWSIIYDKEPLNVLSKAIDLKRII